tara:strand:+ start:390 stop:539 length:150 start_codon:yes stop_codon:yes gene_type:complete
MDEHLVCEDCGKVGDDVRRDTCPFADEINNKQTEVIICPECYYERRMDI